MLFEWGTISFEGYIDSYRESIDFFSKEGVPLRATVSLSLTQQVRKFEPKDKTPRNPAEEQLRLSGDAVPEQTPSTIPPQWSDPGAWKHVAEENGIENIRHPELEEILIPEEGGCGSNGFADASSPALGGAPGEGAMPSAFSGLRQRKGAGMDRPRPPLDVEEDIPPGADTGIGPATSFGIGGRIKNMDGGSLTVDVGQNLSGDELIQFEEV